MKQLVTFEVRDGENEYRDYGIYDHKCSDEENGWYWKDTSVVRINNAEDIDDDKIKIMRDYGVAYEHNI